MHGTIEKQMKNIESCTDQLKTNEKHWIVCESNWKQMKNIESCKDQLKTIKNIELCTIEKLKMHESSTDLLKTKEKHWTVHRSIENKWKTLNRAKINWKHWIVHYRKAENAWIEHGSIENKGKTLNRAQIFWKQMKNIELCKDQLKTIKNIESYTMEKLKMHESSTDLLKTKEKHWIVHRSIENKWKTLNHPRARFNVFQVFSILCTDLHWSIDNSWKKWASLPLILSFRNLPNFSRLLCCLPANQLLKISLKEYIIELAK